MAGEGSRFKIAGYKKPKPFIDVLGKPMIERVMENLSYPNANFILVLKKEHFDAEPETIKFLKEKYNATFVTIEKLTEGTACTVLYARKHINNDIPLLIANSDQIVDMNIAQYIDDCFQKKLDGSILTFSDKELNPKWSFAKINNDGIVTEVAEKKAISEFATVGIYLFSKGNIFVDAAIDMIARNIRTNNEFYTCPVYNHAIENGNKFGIYNIQFEQMNGLGIPEDLDKYISKIS